VDNLFNGLLMALVNMLVTDFAISHTIQNQLNPGQVTSFCFLFVHMYILNIYACLCLLVWA